MQWYQLFISVNEALYNYDGDVWYDIIKYHVTIKYTMFVDSVNQNVK